MHNLASWFNVTVSFYMHSLDQGLQVRQEQAVSSSKVQTRTCSVANAKEMARPEASTENRRSRTPPLEKSQQEWTFGSYNFTTTSVPMLNTTNHKSKLESLEDAGPSLLVSNS